MPDWMTWSPFQSAPTKEICAHMTSAERRKVAAYGALFGFTFSVIAQAPVLLNAFGLISRRWTTILIPAAIMAMFASIPFVQAWLRRFLCNTEWARSQGFKPKELALYDVRFGVKHLLMLMVVVAVIGSVIWNLKSRS
jgi:hypothetical protein